MIFFLNIKNLIHKYIKLKKRYKLSNEFNKIYSILYDYSRINNMKYNFINNFKYKNFPIKKKKGICACVTGKNEKLYIKQFINYYKSIGFDKIIIFDNNSINGENLEDILKDEIYKQFVKLIDIKGLKSVQIPSYNYCYKKFKNKYDWILFIDFDEYLYIKNYKKIYDYIYNKRFKKCESIILSTRFYDDNDLIYYDNRSLIERFTRQNKYICNYKSMVRGGINNLIIPNTHISGFNIHYFCNSKGKKIYKLNNCKKKSDFYIKHFYTKTVEEFCNKLKRGDAHFNKDSQFYRNITFRKIKTFFKINKKTKKKLEILEKCVKLNLDLFKKKI